LGPLCTAGSAGALSMPQSYIKETEHITSVIFKKQFILLNDCVQLQIIIHIVIFCVHTMSGRWAPMFWRKYYLNLQNRSETSMEAVCSSETLIPTYQMAQWCNTQDHNINLHCHENPPVLCITYLHKWVCLLRAGFLKTFALVYHYMKFNNVNVPPFFLYLKEKAEIGKNGWQWGWII
jgi:hypothetical protein